MSDAQRVAIRSENAGPTPLTTEQSVALALRAAKCRFCYQPLEAPDLVKAERDRLRTRIAELEARLESRDG